MKNPTTIILAALTLTGSAWAASPYDMPYGVQWSFLIGSAGDDNPNAVTVSPDGTIWIATDGQGNTGGSPMLAWGSPTGIYGGFFACGYGQINRNGGILQANDIPNVTGISGYNQGRNSTIAFAGNDPTAYFGANPNATELIWLDAEPADDGSNPAQPMTFAINSVLGEVGYAPYADYVNAPGDPEDTTLPRKNDPLDATKKFTHNMVGSDAYGGSAFDFTMGSDGSYYIARGSQGPGVGDPLTEGDSFTVGDFSGPAGASYKPAVGRISADGLTKSGPVHQPECGGRSFFNDIDINESANAGEGRVYASGFGLTRSGGTMDYLDPDGPGTDFAPIAFDPTTPGTRNNFAEKGFALVYNATTWAIDKVVTWESTYGGDIPNDITATADGGFVLVGQTLGSMDGFTNPAEGTSDGYVEVYDTSGALTWKHQTESLISDSFGGATVDTDGSIYISGNSDGDPVLWKFTPGGTLVWSTTIDNGDTLESQRDHGGDKYSIFFLSEHNASAGTWPNTIAYVPQGTDENLLQKLSPGDFDNGTGSGTPDGFVNFDDVQYVGTATNPGLTGDVSYDFNEDGDSTLEDTFFMITNIMDRLVGDIAQDAVQTDVDNADIGRLIGSLGTGTLYLDGDMDFDGAVDAADLTAISEAFTGAAVSGKYANGTPGATLTYRASDGQVWLHADEATGAIITSFQLENAAATFLSANFTGPTAGSFGGSLEEATASVLADTDLTLVGDGGVDGRISLGAVFPTGMDEAGLGAYLTTAVYTGQSGSGQMQFTLVVDPGTPFDIWTGGFENLTDPDFNIDFDAGGLETGIEWVVGGDPSDSSDDAGNAPTFDSSDPSVVKLIFKRRDLAEADSNTTIMVEYGTDLSGWRNTIDHGVSDGVTTDESVDLGGGFHEVTVSIPKTLAVDGKLFARLKVNGLSVVTTP